MQESERRGVPIGIRLILEGLMIVFSVLAALALDAAASERTDRRDETQYLALLQEEFEASRAEVASDREARRAMMVRTESLLDWAAGDALNGMPDPLPIDSLHLWLTDFADYRYYTAVQVVTEDLLSSGSFGLLESDELRRLILALRLEEDRTVVVDERERSFIDDRIEPVLARRLPLEDIANRRGDPEWIRRQVRTLFTEPEMRNLARMRLERTAIAFRFSTGLERILETLVATLETELSLD